MKPTSAISLLYVPRARGSLQTRFFCLANFWCFQKEVNQSIENKTDNLVQQITSKTNTKTSFFSQVHLVFLLNQVRTDDVKKKIIWPSLKVWNLLSIGRGLHFFHTLNEEQLNYSTQHTKWYRKVAWSVVLYHLIGLLLK